uniref:annexin A5-like n=1 Tax=Myxine glutinosa TaxID=7769 RepID=UPI00358F82FC
MARRWTPVHGTVCECEDFDAEVDAKAVYNAMKGLGTDEQTIYGILARRSYAQRQEIAEVYKTCHGSDIVEDISSEISGTLEMVLHALLTPPALYDARELNWAMAGAGTNESCLIEILATRTNEQIKALVEAYETEFEEKLEEKIDSDIGGNLQRFLIALLQGNRDEDGDVDMDKVEDDARALLSASELKWGTDETEFISVLCLRNDRHLWRVFDEYKEISGKDIEETIADEMSGTLEEAMLAVVKSIKKTPAYFARKIREAIQGVGTDERTLLRIIVCRSEIDLQTIKEVFEEEYEESLRSVIEGDVGGDFLSTLLLLCGEE